MSVSVSAVIVRQDRAVTLLTSQKQRISRASCVLSNSNKANEGPNKQQFFFCLSLFFCLKAKLFPHLFFIREYGTFWSKQKRKKSMEICRLKKPQCVFRLSFETPLKAKGTIYTSCSQRDHILSSARVFVCLFIRSRKRSSIDGRGSILYPPLPPSLPLSGPPLHPSQQVMASIR